MMERTLCPTQQRVIVVEIAHSISIEVGRGELLLSAADCSDLDSDLHSQDNVNGQKNQVNASHDEKSLPRLYFSDVDEECCHEIELGHGELRAIVSIII
jgi:hypothetical protein